MKKIILIFLSVFLCISLCGCKKTTQNGIKDVNVPEELYSYWMSTYKSNILYIYNGGMDSDEFWDDLASDDQTYEESFTQEIIKEIKYRVVALWLFDEYKLQLSDAQIDAIDADIAEKIEYAGSKDAINKDLSKMGMNVDMLREVYIANAKYDAVKEHLYGSGGVEAPNEKDRAAYYNSNYYCIKYITIYSGSVLKTDSSGSYVYDEDGQIELVELTEEEKTAKAELIDNIMSELEAGGNFEEYITEYSEVDYSSYPNGFFITDRDYNRFGTDIVGTAKELNVGEIKKVSDDVVTYIIKKYPLPQYVELSSEDKNQLSNMDDSIIIEKLTSKFDVYAKDVVVSEELMSKYKIREVSENSYF